MGELCQIVRHLGSGIMLAVGRSASCSPGKLCLAGFNHPSVPPVAAFDPDNRAVEQASGLEDDRIVVGNTPTHQQNPLTFA
jgi:hypothetical protein